MAIGQEEIGQRIKEAREGAGLTQQELAERIGIKQGQTVSNYERGVTEVTTKRLRRIAEATRKPVSFFVQDEATEPVPVELEDRLEALAAAQELHGELLRELLRRLPHAPDGDQAAGS